MSIMIDSMRKKEKKLEAELEIAIRHLQLCPVSQTEEARAERNRIARELDVLCAKISQQIKKEKREKDELYQKALDRRNRPAVRSLGKTARNKAKPGYKDPKTRKAEKSERDKQIRRAMQSSSGKTK